MSARGWIARLLCYGIHLYRGGLSPLLPHSCRFEPSCSAYALEALARHGAAKGLALTLRRLGRCHPWGGFGFDPVPPVSGFTSEKKSATQIPPSLPPRSL